MNGLRRKAAARSQRGITMVEVLIAVLVLSAGLIGLAGLQGVSLNNSYSAYQRSQAVALAYEVMDRVRADRDTFANGATLTDFESDGDADAAARLTQGELELDWTNGILTVTVTWLDDRLAEDAADKLTTLTLASRI